MKANHRWMLVAAALTGCLSLVLLGRRTETLPAPRIPSEPARAAEDPTKIPRVLRLSPETLEFGEIALGEKKTLSVSVENPGSRPVAVLRTLFSCACLGGGMERPTIDPGQTGTLNITFTGVPGRRSYSTTVSVITDEPGACRYEVGIRGKVEQEFTLDPETLTFGTMELNDERTLETVIRRRDGRSFEIREIPLKPSRLWELVEGR